MRALCAMHFSRFESVSGNDIHSTYLFSSSNCSYLLSFILCVIRALLHVNVFNVQCVHAFSIYICSALSNDRHTAINWSVWYDRARKRDIICKYMVHIWRKCHWKTYLNAYQCDDHLQGGKAMTWKISRTQQQQQQQNSKQKSKERKRRRNNAKT